ncbi:protein of unknown function DUF362 [Methanococcus aeolicus Nankai-3]|uniref:4Fe-4S ferredoxin-type domain-containing protein n=1 Tax=Methanococcus aeolicus (strain ATCC BAA-1280 / DSM 17508 / OCM 812 / Nankai-3) TaxID=419665 RepID=A6UVE5_META3|nr:DUF362 domain-containing protein [Methanococcus aeolicus]ABR56467.1 protein of unknown function DUF362 [Methanococcus aeolicus Nankai-3]
MEVYYSKIENYGSLNNKNKILDKVFNNLNLKEYNKILIKPNVLGPYPPERNATTHPLFLEWVILYLLNNEVDKNKIIVGDSSGYNTKNSFEVSRIKEICEKHNIKWLPFEGDETVEIEVMGNELHLPKSLVDSDLIINLPKLKTHILMKYTGAVKNLYGCIPGGMKPKLHGIYSKENDFAKFVGELHNVITKNKKTISIMDGINGMEGNGPSNGKSINSKIVIASNSAIAVDILASQYMGYNENDIITNNILKNGAKLNILCVDNNDNDSNNDNPIDINEIPKMKFKKPDTYFMMSILPPKVIKLIFSIMVQKPKIHKRRCRKCKICEMVCPVNAITISNFKVDAKKCINCYCCHEMCGFDAIILKRRLFN